MFMVNAEEISVIISQEEYIYKKQKKLLGEATTNLIESCFGGDWKSLVAHQGCHENYEKFYWGISCKDKFW